MSEKYSWIEVPDLPKIFNSGLYNRVFNDDEFERKHPRHSDGTFSEVEESRENKDMLKTEDFLGQEYTGVKGQDAVTLLMAMRKGFVNRQFFLSWDGADSLTRLPHTQESEGANPSPATN